MSRKVILITVAFVLLCIAIAYASPSAAAISPARSTAKINGYVVSEDGKPVPGAAVYLYENGKPAQVKSNPVKTDANGFYSFKVKSPGDYRIEASKGAYNYTATAPVKKGTYKQNLTLPAALSKFK